MSKSLNIARMLEEASRAKEETAPGPPNAAIDPEAALLYHRSLWPLNQKVVAGKLPEAPEGSDRVRMRRAAAELADNGISMDGSFANNFYDRRSEVAHLVVRARFDSSGAIGTMGCKINVKNINKNNKKNYK